MKSSFWVLCGVTLLCLGSVRCSRHFSDNDDNFLDKTREEYDGRTLKEKNNEWELNKAREVWNGLTNVISELDRMRDEGKPEPEPCSETNCLNGECKEGTCVCTDGFRGDKCEIIPKDQCKIENCYETGGTCKSVDTKDSIQCECPQDKRYKEKEGCITKCSEDTCYNGQCNPDNEKCDCTTGFTGDKCEIFPKDKCGLEKCAVTGGTCKSVDTKEKVVCECPQNKRLVANEGCKNLCTLDNCFNGKCNEVNQNCECDGRFEGDKCEIFPYDLCEIANCIKTGGICISVNKKDSIQCKCDEDKRYIKDEGCKDLCQGVTCYNGKCNADIGKCDCTSGFTGDKCEIFPSNLCEIEKCTETGGTCKSVNKKENIQCECPQGKRLVGNEGCKVCDAATCYNGECNPDTGKCDCTSGFTGDKCEIFPKDKCKLEKCAETEGICKSVDKKENVVCECPQNKRLVAKEGCKDLCEGVTCYNGNCNAGTGKCDCTDGYSGDKCEIVSKEQCKIEKCYETGGTCKSVDTKDNIQCECPQDKRYKEKEGCINLCEGVTCYNGKCNLDTGKCDCTTGFTGNKCEIFPEDACKEANKTCAATKGQCISVGIGKVNCKCPEGTRFVENGGCKDICEGVICYNEGTCEKSGGKATCKCAEGFNGSKCEIFPKEKCEEKIDKCVDTNGTCKSVDTKNVTCECRTGLTFVEGDGCKKTEDVNCNEVCGDSDGVICGGNKKIKDRITCTCKEATEDFDKRDKTCKFDYCKEKCDKIKCEGNKFEASEIQCKCPEDDQDFIDEEKICKINYCRSVCGTANCDGEKYETKNPKCSCDENHLFINKGCKLKCTKTEECGENRNCHPTGKYCRCDDGYEGDDCTVVTGCKTLKAKCDEIKRQCVFDKGAPGKATCECEGDYKYYRKANTCSLPCKDKKCEGNRDCNNDNFCVCKSGYEGDDCTTVSGCKDMKAKCDELKVPCVFDQLAHNKATCNCTEGFNYDRRNNKCEHKFCFPNNPCVKPANCTFDESSSIAYCQCKENQYYNYETQKCQAIADKCLLREKPCDEDHTCDKATGDCKCKYPVGEDKKCIAKRCAKNPCLTGAKCKEEDGSCYCEEGKYFTGKKCEALTCNLKDYKKNCACPVDTKRTDENPECVHVKEDEKCNTECGYGICVKKGQNETCKCFNSIALSLGSKCTLRKSFCASEKPQGELQNNTMKCKCEGKYKQADDDITCTLKTCDDKDVQQECAAKGATCVMDWKKGYDCQCPTGYVKDKNANETCTDPCGIEKNIKDCASKGKFCYNTYSAKNSGTSSCQCPPTTKEINGVCSGKSENSYLIENIPVLKEEYKLNSGINKMLLNAHLIQSLQQTFRNDLFDYGYLYDYNVHGDTIICSVWINFKSDPDATELAKIKMAANTFSKVCKDCKDAVVWPPSLLLSEKGLKEVKSEKQGFCKVKERLCGKGASCYEDKQGNGKCFCDKGYKLIEYSIRMLGPHEVQRCEDVNECAEGTYKCPSNSACRNTFGNYSCVCEAGFQKEKKPTDPDTDKSDCVNMCTPNPCKKGTCELKEKTFDCKCQAGIGGSFCDREDENYKSAKKSTVVVGAVLGTILAVGAVAALYYIIKKRKRSGSEDFMPAARMDHAEMTERRHMRGVTNKAYE